MRNRIWCALVITAFVAGYGTHTLISDSDKTPAPSEQTFISSSAHSSSSESQTFADIEFPDEFSSSASNKKSSSSISTNSSASQSVSSHSTSSTAALTNAATDTANSSASTAANQLSDDEIDQRIPKPFNASFKKAHPSLKEKYKDFLDTDHHRKDDWDLRMQGLLTDFVLSRPAAADITIESITCNANMCEMRLFEQKKFLLLGLFGELMQQPWMNNQVNGSVDFNPDSSACYILIMRKQS